MSERDDRTATPRGRGLAAAGLALGFGLGGFFDGILLHQILQWHHLLSGIEAGGRDLRWLVLGDGLFHLVMYLVTLAGLFLLWRNRRQAVAAGAGRRLAAAALAGFGIWHMADGLLSHWIFGLHRIRMDVTDPLAWDLCWFAVFGLAPAVAGWWIARSGEDGGAGGGAEPEGDGSLRGDVDGRPRGILGARRAAVPLVLVALVVLAGPAAALPPGLTAGENGPVIVLFRPGAGPVDVMTAIAAVDGRLVWTDASQQLVAIDLPPGGSAGRLYRHGALLVSGSLLPAGCLDWSRI